MKRCAFKIIVIALGLTTLSSCYRTPNLNGQTIGSLAGAVGGGLLAASQVSGDLIVIGSGTVIGSILGGIVGASFDDMDRVYYPDPLLWPIGLDCYQTRRPLYMAAYCPGLAVPPDNPNTYRRLAWRDYPRYFPK